MEENYSTANALNSDNIPPRDIVIKRILAFSKSYSNTHNQNKALDLLKN